MSKNEDLTKLRKHYRDMELYLAWLSRKGMSEEAYLLRKQMSDTNGRICDLIWRNARLVPISDNDLSESLQDALGELFHAHMAAESGYHAVFVSLVNPDAHRTDRVMIVDCDDPRPGYYQIEGRVQNITEWIERNC